MSHFGVLYMKKEEVARYGEILLSQTVERETERFD